MRRANLLVAVLVCASCSSPSAPSQPSVDVLAYLIGDAALWPRVGNHGQNQVVDPARQEICWTKYANPRRFECWRWDDAYVYHAVDHALDGDINDSYSFTDGRWMPRYLPDAATAAAPWSLDVAQNRITWFDPSCVIDPARSPHRFVPRSRIRDSIARGDRARLEPCNLFRLQTRQFGDHQKSKSIASQQLRRWQPGSRVCLTGLA